MPRGVQRSIGQIRGLCAIPVSLTNIKVVFFMFQNNIRVRYFNITENGAKFKVKILKIKVLNLIF